MYVLVNRRGDRAMGKKIKKIDSYGRPLKGHPVLSGAYPGCHLRGVPTVVAQPQMHCGYSNYCTYCGYGCSH